MMTEDQKVAIAFLERCLDYNHLWIGDDDDGWNLKHAKERVGLLKKDRPWDFIMLKKVICEQLPNGPHMWHLCDELDTQWKLMCQLPSLPIMSKTSIEKLRFVARELSEKIGNAKAELEK